jgi:CRP/FNR family cyclic AMP-dependent transcriptional regulator
MFQRLTPSQALEILKICTPRSFSSKELVVQHGSKSTEMLILLSGRLAVTAPDRTVLTYLTPITSVGEMGVITGQPRSANVVVAEQASAFVLSRIKFEVLIKKFPDIGFVIYRNIIQTLSTRLGSTNDQLADCQREISELRSTVAG